MLFRLHGNVALSFVSEAVRAATSLLHEVLLEQLLRCNKAVWVRMSELLTSLRKGDSGELPTDAALDKLPCDSKVMMHLITLPGSKWKGDGKKATDCSSSTDAS